MALDGHPSMFTLDVGAGGFCVEVMRVLPAGTPLRGSIFLEGREAVFAGTVVWAHPGDPRLNLRGRMGVRFLRVAQGFADQVERRDPAH